MLNDASGFKHIYLCTRYTYLRRGIDGLIAVVNAGFKLDPRESGSIFLFCGRIGDRIKALLYEGDGWLLCYKRFTDGKLQWPRSTSEARTLTPQPSENFQLLSEQSSVLIKQIESLKEQLAILTNHRFGRKTEVSSQIPGQLSLDFGDQAILNEAELSVAESLPEEPTIEEVIVRKNRTKGKRAANLDSIEVESVCHACTEEELTKQFPKGWHELPDEIYKELLYTPAKFKVLEHHIKVYAGDCDKGEILRAKAPNRLLSHSILTPELAAAVFNVKYVNAMPLNRLSEESLRNDVNIPRQDMAGWMICLADYYLEPVHKMMKAELLQSHHVHCDETPFIMPEHSKEYMCVFLHHF